MQDGIIPGAVPAQPEDIDPVVATYSRELGIVVYCACPNEESAAMAAKHLKQAGFKKIRPLLGGIDAWVQAGQPVERALPSASTWAGPGSANPLWGAPRIHGELLKLGIDVGQTTIAKYMDKHKRPPSASPATRPT